MDVLKDGELFTNSPKLTNILILKLKKIACYYLQDMY